MIDLHFRKFSIFFSIFVKEINEKRKRKEITMSGCIQSLKNTLICSLTLILPFMFNWCDPYYPRSNIMSDLF